MNLRKDHCRTLETEQPVNDETSLSAARSLNRFRACRFRGYASAPQPGYLSRLDLAHSFRISQNPGTKSVKEHATKQPSFRQPGDGVCAEAVLELKSKTTLGNGYLGSRIDEERSEMRYLV